ncbi:MAG: biliverdin-producing heme oxygenase [Phenylobacterium sp.]|jgi:heme oxygenase|uniref:biliverdin-producing heme oxygenase n=1 Tax=Phenylobacterium sp. TaxID=1871053 RepID=UPI002A3445C9|nr:biliverdin-producing heme oxygenase [Phenylobacterium sp.]MDD3837330.1 biliverdin-producing heme oxygenase [Phenylobacterium sp.]MDX9997227.1 biliverdin-producing heme oxygenase [Phenylobacterium sp.]
MSVLAAVRAATRERHEELETNAGILDRLADPAGRPALLAAFLSLYAPAEATLEPLLAPIPDYDFEGRRKTPALRRDLQVLGAGAPPLPAAPPPVFSGRAEALGFAYVLEGSTLGGRVIRKRLRAAGRSLDGTSFFDVYGPATGARWTSFCAILERECADRAAEAVAGALAGFAWVRAGLAAEPAAA